MAGDKKTILDVVKAADQMNTYKGYSNDPDISKYLYESFQDRKEVMREKGIPGLVKEALSEEHPTAGGTYKGSVYYSNILPEDQGDIPWPNAAATIVEKASQYGAKKSDILAAQNYFVDIGYMHHSEVDGRIVPQLYGMISRWNKNAGVSKEAMFDAMETWKDNFLDLFSRDKE